MKDAFLQSEPVNGPGGANHQISIRGLLFHTGTCSPLLHMAHVRHRRISLLLDYFLSGRGIFEVSWLLLYLWCVLRLGKDLEATCGFTDACAKDQDFGARVSAEGARVLTG